MAISTSFSNFFSFLSPQTKPQLPLLSQFPSHHNNHRNNKIIPLVLSRNETSSSSISSSPPPPPPPPTPPPQDISSDFADFTSSSLYSKSRYNVEVVLEDGESEERFLNRFRREVRDAGIIQECRRRRFFENKQEEKKRRIRDAAKRNRRMRLSRRPPYKNHGDDRYHIPTSPVMEEDDDSWDLPEEDVIKF